MSQSVVRGNLLAIVGVGGSRGVLVPQSLIQYKRIHQLNSQWKLEHLAKL